MEPTYRRVRSVISKEYHILLETCDIRNRFVILEMHIVYLLHAPYLQFPCYMDPYAVNMTLGTSVATHSFISTRFAM